MGRLIFGFRLHRVATLGAVIVSLSACAADEGTPIDVFGVDSGSHDAGTGDANVLMDATVETDLGVVDAGRVDATVTDASSMDAMSTDAGTPDSGVDSGMIIVGTDDDHDGYGSLSGDCDDGDPRVHRGATSAVDGVDFNCDGYVDWIVDITVSADDAYDLCIDGHMVATGTGHPDAEHYSFVLRAGDHVIGAHGHDTSGVSAGLVAYVRAAGNEFGTFGVREGDADATRWRYYPDIEEAPQESWCDVGFDDSDWGPALLNDQLDDGVWLMGPPELYGIETDWIWDGRPRSLHESWFRRSLELPNESAPVPATPATACTVGAQTTLSPGIARLHNGADIAFDGTQLFAVMDAYGRGWGSGVDDAYLQIVNPTDLSSVGTRTMINDTGATWWNTFPSIAHGAAGFGVAWEDGRANRDTDQIYFRSLNASGAAESPEIRIVNTSEQSSRPVVAWNGTDYAVAWQDERDGQTEIYAARVTQAGVTSVLPTRITNALGRSRFPSLVWNPTSEQYLLAWQDNLDGTRTDGNEEIYAARLDEALAVVGSVTRVTNDTRPSGEPRVAVNGAGFGLVHSDEMDANRELYFVPIDEDGVVGTRVRITRSRGASTQPSLVRTATGWAVAFRDTRDDNDEIYLVELMENGTPVDAPTRLTTTTGHSFRPHLVTTAAHQYVVMWEEELDPAAAPFQCFAVASTVTCP